MEEVAITKERLLEMQKEKAKESIQKAKELLEANGYEVKEKSKWLNGELGVIDIDGYGCRIYEDVVHDIGNGNFKYRIKEVSQQGIIIPERPDIPSDLWGKKVSNQWIQWSTNEKKIEDGNRIR